MSETSESIKYSASSTPKVKKHGTWISTNSIEFNYGVSLNELASVLLISRNMMSLIHRRKRILSDSSLRIMTEMDKAMNSIDPKVLDERIQTVHQRIQEISTSHQKNTLQKLQYSIGVLKRKIEEHEKQIADAVLQQMRAEAINSSNLKDATEIEQLKAFQTIVTLKREKQLKNLINKSLPEMKIKLRGMEAMVAAMEELKI